MQTHNFPLGSCFFNPGTTPKRVGSSDQIVSQKERIKRESRLLWLLMLIGAGATRSGISCAGHAKDCLL